MSLLDEKAKVACNQVDFLKEYSIGMLGLDMEDM